MRLLGCSLSITVRQALPTAVGRTQPSSVMPVVRSSESASGTVTQSLMPSKLSAPPNFPVALRTGPLSVPVLPRPEATAVVVAPVSSKPHAPTRLDGACGPTVSVTVTVFGEPVAPGAVKVMSVVYVPTAKSVIVGVAVTVAAFVPPVGDTLSHAAFSDAVQLIEPEPVFETLTVLVAGLLPPTVAVNASVAGVTDNTGGGGGSTVSVTVTVFGEPVAPAAASVMSSV